ASSHHAPNAALLIDFDNVTMGIRSDLQTELKNLLSSDIVKGKVSVQRAYADWRRYPQYIVPLSESSIDLIFAPAYGSAKKNATDIRLAIDALELVFTRPEIGTFILLSGDSDFSSLVIKLKEYGKYVIGVGIRESSSDLLVEKNVGMSKFSRFVSEAAHRGLLTLTKLENGQFEVDAPSSATPGLPAGQETVEAHALRQPSTEEGPATERPRRGRRGGRGRDREGRGHRPQATAAAAAAAAPVPAETPATT